MARTYLGVSIDRISNAALSLECPYCAAKEAQACKTANGSEMRNFHTARMELAHEVTTSPTMKTKGSMLSHRDWLNLGVLAVNAADAALRHGNRTAAAYYTTLAYECDRRAEK